MRSFCYKVVDITWDVYKRQPIDTPEREPLAPYSLIEKTKWINLFGEENLTLKGRVIGGCLEVLVSLVGTPYDNVKNFIKKYKDDNIIWF